jgi:hypothetical protein
MTHVVSRPVQVLTDAVATGADKVFAAPGMTEFSITVEGIVAGDIITVEGSNDGTNWGAAATTITVDGQYNIEGGSTYLRANVTTWGGGGTINAWIAGT